MLNQPLRFADFSPMILNIFIGSIFASHSISNLIMVIFLILCKCFRNPRLKIIRMSNSCNRAVTCFPQFLWCIVSEHVCKLFRYILERVLWIIITYLYSSRQCRCNHIQLALKCLICISKGFFIKTFLIHDFINTAETKNCIVFLSIIFLYYMNLKMTQSGFIWYCFKGKMIIIFLMKPFPDVSST